jgi:hypothetical protein
MDLRRRVDEMLAEQDEIQARVEDKPIYRRRLANGHDLHPLPGCAKSRLVLCPWRAGALGLIRYSDG